VGFVDFTALRKHAVVLYVMISGDVEDVYGNIAARAHCFHPYPILKMEVVCSPEMLVTMHKTATSLYTGFSLARLAVLYKCYLLTELSPS
jgi:hypothetical protein